MHADLAIELKGGVAHQRRQLAGGAASRQIHLEETVLGVDEAGGPGDVATRDATDGGNAEPVTFDRHSRLQAAHPHRAVDDRETGAQLGSRPVRTSGEREHERNAGNHETAYNPPHLGRGRF